MQWDLRRVTMPHQPGFNDYDNNAALYVADWRNLDGHFYGIFHSRMTPKSKQNMDHWLGIARSKDLRNWQFPEGAPPAGGDGATISGGEGK